MGETAQLKHDTLRGLTSPHSPVPQTMYFSQTERNKRSLESLRKACLSGWASPLTQRQVHGQRGHWGVSWTEHLHVDDGGDTNQPCVTLPIALNVDLSLGVICLKKWAPHFSSFAPPPGSANFSSFAPPSAHGAKAFLRKQPISGL